MKRVALLIAVLSVAVALVPRSSAAQSIPGTDFCLQQPGNILTSCVSPTTTATLTPTPIPVDKELNVTGPTPGLVNTSQYGVTVISRHVCFSYTEPVSIGALGSPGAAALTALYPQPEPSWGDFIRVRPDRATGMAQLVLEVFNPAIQSSAGLYLKAVWGQEGIERIVPIATPVPPTPGGTIGITATPTTGPTLTPTPQLPLTVKPCVYPDPVLNGGSATLYAQTLPGAACTATARGSAPPDPNAINPLSSVQVGSPDGFVSWNFGVSSASSQGFASVTCTLDGQIATGTTFFTILHPPTPTPVATGAGGGPSAPSLSPYCRVGAGVVVNAAVENVFVNRSNPETVFGCITENGKPVSGVPMQATFRFFTRDNTCSSTTDNTGVASCSQDITFAPTGFPIYVDVTFTYKGQLYTARTFFIASG